MTAIQKQEKALQKVGASQLMAQKAQALSQRKSIEGLVLLLDCSGSMNAPFAGSTRFTAMVGALAHLPQVRKVWFNDHVSDTMLRPHGGTDLAAALRYVQGTNAKRILLISDGLPDDEGAALTVANVPVDVLFIGESGTDGERFMRLLASTTGGNVVVITKADEQNAGNGNLIATKALLLLNPPK